MRAYESKKDHSAFTLVDGELVELNDYQNTAPANVMMGGIANDSAKVRILPPFIKMRILKPGAMFTVSNRNGRKYHNLMPKFGNTDLLPGDSIPVMGQPRLFSLSAYTFQTREQYERWKRSHNRMLNRDGLSFERYFVNADGVTVDYQKMLEGVDDE
jgi:hypothetical protein